MRYRAWVLRDMMMSLSLPERMLWASNWPYLMTTPRPDDTRMLELLSEWAPDTAIQKRILCDNPQEVYGFDAIKSEA